MQTRLSLALPNFPTLKNIQGLAQFDEDQERKDKWKATITTNMGVAEGEYNFDFFEMRYRLMTPAIGGNDNDALDGDVLHPDGESGKSKSMVKE